MLPSARYWPARTEVFGASHLAQPGRSINQPERGNAMALSRTGEMPQSRAEPLIVSLAAFVICVRDLIAETTLARELHIR